MKSAAIGIRMHSGWGALVAVSVQAAMVEVRDRTRIVIADSNIPGSRQPYHFAVKLELAEAKKYLSDCATASEHLARAAIETVLQQLHAREYQVIASAVLLASGRQLPSLPEILRSHPLLHTAEGEFFRRAFRRACEHLDIPVTGIRERDLEECASLVFGELTGQVTRRISGLKTSIGSPWTEDQKKASLAASIVLAGSGGGVRIQKDRSSL